VLATRSVNEVVSEGRVLRLVLHVMCRNKAPVARTEAGTGCVFVDNGRFLATRSLSLHSAVFALIKTHCMLERSDTIFRSRIAQHNANHSHRLDGDAVRSWTGPRSHPRGLLTRGRLRSGRVRRRALPILPVALAKERS
jgi:hypothetical protein